MILAHEFAPDDLSEIITAVAVKRQVLIFDADFSARSLGVSRFKIQAAVAIVLQGARIMIPRTLIFERYRGFVMDSPVPFLFGIAGHLAPVSAAFRLELIYPKM